MSSTSNGTTKPTRAELEARIAWYEDKRHAALVALSEAKQRLDWNTRELARAKAELAALEVPEL